MLLSLVVSSEDTIFILTIYKNGHFKKSMTRKVGYVSAITLKMLTFCDRTTDVTYSTDVTFFCALPVIAAFFSSYF